MAWTSGFFNSVNGDRTYNTDQMSSIFRGLITDGVYESVGNKLAVQPNNGMTIQVNTGRGWFAGRWVNNDSEYLQTLEGSDVLLNRYCAVCVRVDTTDENRKAELYFKYSDFATDPVKPEMERTESVNEYCLAYVYIAAGVTEITAADIEDTRPDTSLCGWVTGLIEQVNTTTLWEQWQAQFEQFMNQEQTDFENWFNALVDYMNEDIEAQLTADVLQLKADVAELKEGKTAKATGTFDGLGWNSQEDGSYLQTIAVEGVTTESDLVVFPSDEYKDTYCEMGCEAIGQAENSITFRCTDPQDVAVVVEVIVLN